MNYKSLLILPFFCLGCSSYSKTQRNIAQADATVDRGDIVSEVAENQTCRVNNYQYIDPSAENSRELAQNQLTMMFFQPYESVSSSLLREKNNRGHWGYAISEINIRSHPDNSRLKIIRLKMPVEHRENFDSVNIDIEYCLGEADLAKSHFEQFCQGTMSLAMSISEYQRLQNPERTLHSGEPVFIVDNGKIRPFHNLCSSLISKLTR